ncbi:MAG: surface lipoprotein assembly modifier [Pseudoxanthomonas sp.]
MQKINQEGARPAWPAKARLLLLATLLPMLGLLPMRAPAQDRDDARRLLEQGVQLRAIERERDLLKDERDDQYPTLTIDGRTYTVQHNANDLGQALYLMLQQRQWQAAAHFLAEYLGLPDPDPMLVHYARGTLARVRGHYSEAEREFRALLALQPDFLLGRLELARTLFEDQQDRESADLFDAIAGSLDKDDAKNVGVLRTVETFRQALRNRRAWNGSVSLGPAWSDNVSRTSASDVCLYYFGGECIIERQMPGPTTAVGLDYDASLDRRLPLYGHHGLYLRGLLFGQSWREQAGYNELSFSAQAGYSYRSGRHAFSLAPSFDYYALGNHALYGAWGLHGEWSYTLTPASLLKLEGDWKDLRYRTEGYARNYDGVSRSIYATYFRSLGPRWTLFGGLDVVDSAAPAEVNAYLQKGARLGASLQWPDGFTSTLFGSYRHRDYGAYSPLLGERREDDEQNYVLILKTSRWAFAGFTPLLTLRHNRVGSNVDWLYSYDKNSVSLKLERTF